MLHARLEAFAAQLIETMVPPGIWKLAAQAGRITQLLAPVGGALHVSPQQLAQLADLPRTPEQLRRAIAQELRQRRPEQLATLIEQIGDTADAWLTEYRQSLTEQTEPTEESAADGGPAPDAEESAQPVG